MKKTSQASTYLGKFAQLMRKYLDFSHQEHITLQDEVDSLTTYLEIEAMRFGDLFSFTITVSEKIEAAYINIPTMLVQPYVENAIKHGLLHKEGLKKLEIVFQQKSENFIACIITDNGVGRKAADEINKNNFKKHKSFATRATAERLSLLNQDKKFKAGVSIIDMYDGNVATGTQVALQIPIKK